MEQLKENKFGERRLQPNSVYNSEIYRPHSLLSPHSLSPIRSKRNPKEKQEEKFEVMVGPNPRLTKIKRNNKLNKVKDLGFVNLSSCVKQSFSNVRNAQYGAPLYSLPCPIVLPKINEESPPLRSPLKSIIKKNTSMGNLTQGNINSNQDNQESQRRTSMTMNISNTNTKYGIPKPKFIQLYSLVQYTNIIKSVVRDLVNQHTPFGFIEDEFNILVDELPPISIYSTQLSHYKRSLTDPNPHDHFVQIDPDVIQQIETGDDAQIMIETGQINRITTEFGQLKSYLSLRLEEGLQSCPNENWNSVDNLSTRSVVNEYMKCNESFQTQFKNILINEEIYKDVIVYLIAYHSNDTYSWEHDVISFTEEVRRYIEQGHELSHEYLLSLITDPHKMYIWNIAIRELIFFMGDKTGISRELLRKEVHEYSKQVIQK